MRWTLKKKQLWYKMTGKPVWYHRRCIDYDHPAYYKKNNVKARFLKPYWILDWHCPRCGLHIESEDFILKRKAEDWTLPKIDPSYKQFSFHFEEDIERKIIEYSKKW